MFIKQIQDITVRSRTETALRASELKGRTVGQLGEILQACQTIDEIGAPLADACLALFPGCAGTLYVLNNSENWLRGEYTWGDEPISEPVLPSTTAGHCAAASVAAHAESEKCQPMQTHQRRREPGRAKPLSAHGRSR